MKKAISILLALVIITLSFASCMKAVKVEQSQEKETKWVVVSETTIVGNGTDIIEYEYDDEGKCTSEKGMTGITYYCYDFKYDKNGNVIHKICKYEDNTPLSWEMTCNYTYDSKGNCLSVEEISSDRYYVTYEYDEHGSVIKENYQFDDENGSSKYVRYYTPEYEDGVCVQSEIIQRNLENSLSFYKAESYEYDRDGNKTKTTYYNVVENPANTDNLISINGKYYEKSGERIYEWEKIEISENNED